MEVEYKNKDIKEKCLDRRVATRKLGAQSARKLKARLADCRAAANVRELIAGNPHPLTGDRQGEFALNLAGGHRLVFAPLKDPPPMKESGGISWDDVEGILIVFIGDYHD